MKSSSILVCVNIGYAIFKVLQQQVMKFNNTNVCSSLGVKLIKDKDLWRAMILSIDIKSEQKVEIQ